MEVIMNVAKKEDFVLPPQFAASIVAASGRNLRKALLCLESCKVESFPFQPTQTPRLADWELYITVRCPHTPRTCIALLHCYDGQCCCFSRIIGQVTPKNIYFYYLIVYLQDNSIPGRNQSFLKKTSLMMALPNHEARTEWFLSCHHISQATPKLICFYNGSEYVQDQSIPRMFHLAWWSHWCAAQYSRWWFLLWYDVTVSFVPLKRNVEQYVLIWHSFLYLKWMPNQYWLIKSIPINTEQSRSILINTDQYRSIPINTDQYWLILINTDQYWSIPINTDQTWSILINPDQCWSILINTDRHWSILINTDQINTYWGWCLLLYAHVWTFICKAM